MITIKKVENPRVVYQVRVTEFPGGEVGVNINTNCSGSSAVMITAFLRSSKDVMALLLTADAIRRTRPDIRLGLTLPYIPYARQDRVCNSGEALSIAVFASLINSMKFEEVIVLDPHSDVAPALIERCTVVPSSKVFYHSMFYADKWIVAPDAGAAKRCESFAKHVGAAGVIQCVKHRDPATGALSGFRALDSVEGKNLVVLDDILDGGRTFIGLAAELNGAASKVLMVTHGIFSAGVEEIVKHYDKIYTTNSFWGVVPEHLKHSKILWQEV